MKNEINKPSLRFKGYENYWLPYKLEEFGKSTSGISLEKHFNKKGIYKVISIGSYSDNNTYVDQGIRVGKNKETENSILLKDDLTMILNDKTIYGNIIGRVLLINKNNEFAFNQRSQRIEVDKIKFIPEFLYQLLNADKLRNKIRLSAQGNTQIYVNWSVIKKIFL